MAAGILHPLQAAHNRDDAVLMDEKESDLQNALNRLSVVTDRMYLCIHVSKTTQASLASFTASDIEQLKGFASGGYCDESTIVYLQHPCVILTALEVLDYRVVASSSTAVKQDYNEYMWTMRKEFAEPEPQGTKPDLVQVTSAALYLKLDNSGAGYRERNIPGADQLTNASAVFLKEASDHNSLHLTHLRLLIQVVSFSLINCHTATEEVFMMSTYWYVAVKGSLHAQDCSVFGLIPAEVEALCKRYSHPKVEVASPYKLSTPSASWATRSFAVPEKRRLCGPYRGRFRREYPDNMPHIVVKGNVDGSETKVFGLNQKEFEEVQRCLQTFGGRVGQDGHTFTHSPLQVLDVLHMCFNYKIITSTAQGHQACPIWTMHRPFY
uniref:Uncharacterized protein n=1 Tax=Timema genevievae TaxID=629358 RepID=A0A7R9PJ12_TIMGE|nr:unnamed protein product [Timema genevievae]